MEWIITFVLFILVPFALFVWLIIAIIRWFNRH